MNSLSHGLTASRLTIPGESEEEAAEYIENVIADLDPRTLLQEELAREVAVRQWRLRRAPRAEAGLYQQWLLVDLPSRQRAEKASRPKMTPELLKKLGHEERPLSEEELRKLQEKALEQARQSEHAELGEAISIDSSGPNALSNLIRYETRLSRLRDQSLAAFLALKREQEREFQRELGP